MNASAALFEVTDPTGVRVRLDANTWHVHIVPNRRYLEGNEQVVANTIVTPTMLCTGNDPTYDRIAYGFGALQRAPYDEWYLAVIYRLTASMGTGVLRTAYATSRPKGKGTVLHVPPR